MRHDKTTLIDRYMAIVNTMVRLPAAMRGNETRNPIEVRLRAELTDIAHQVAAKQLTWGTTGRLSARLGAQRTLISVPNKAFQSIQTADFFVQGWSGSNAVSELDPTWNLHQALYAVRSDVKAILQAQPPFTTVLGSLESLAPLPVPEVTDFWSRVACMDADSLGASALANAVIQAAQHSNILLLKHRGVFCWSTSLSELVLFVETVESVARMFWLNHLARAELSPAVASDVLARL